MPMSAKGLNKLMEECGELVQVAAKKAAYINQNNHPDGAGALDLRMEDEMGDVLAAIQFVSAKLNLSDHDIQARATMKFRTFQNWYKE
jgi:NTP pyrophosphatase (non-canonical NTP hydrolase)